MTVAIALEDPDRAWWHPQSHVLHDSLQRDSHKPHCPPTSVTWLQLLRRPTNTGSFTALFAENCPFNAHATSRAFHTRDVTLCSLMLLASGAGDFLELILLYFHRQRAATWRWVWHVSLKYFYLPTWLHGDNPLIITWIKRQPDVLCFKILKIYLHYSALHVSDTIVSIIRSFSAAHAVTT